MHIAILTFQGFDELDSLVALGVLNRIKKPGWRVTLCCPETTVTSMNGVTVHAQSSLDEVASADAVIVGSGIKTREVVANSELMSRLRLNPKRQLVGAQCSGALILAKLGMLGSVPTCTDLTTKPWVQEAGVEVLNQPFFASGNVATAAVALPRSTLPPGSSLALKAKKPQRQPYTMSLLWAKKKSTFCEQ